MRQWTKDATQKFGKIKRSYDDIRKKRVKDFKKFKTVTANYSIENISTTGQQVTIIVKYSMSFRQKNNRQFNENTTEKYVLVYDLKTKRWLIRENNDYLR